ncbi:ATP-binding protein [Pelagicoccus sp. SDUM812003]|uniref:ATP-binding protein n=1 Tax=Pelagicoccus sp. SDUM812003 TaxID=3041267 RepID=UPI00280E000A|nr:ATP-binding protein [Pelagicoccus sp. SDUM812003]MDQ8204079.1 ATP-binding protein [Pelagicoccus sp. SDUM812003]
MSLHARETGVPSFRVFEPEMTGVHQGINSIRQDGLGRLLIASGTDLVTFDGNDWVQYRQVSFHGEKTWAVLDTVVGGDGVLYAGTEYGFHKIEFLRGFQFRLVPVFQEEGKEPRSMFYFRKLQSAGDGIYGFGYRHLSYFDLEKGELRHLTHRRDFGISHAARDADGDLFLFNTVGGLWKREAERWVEKRPAGDPSSMRVVRSHVELPDGRLILGTDYHGLLELANDSLVAYPTEIDDVGASTVKDLALLQDGHIVVSLLGFGVALMNEAGEFVQVMSRDLDYRFSEASHLLPTSDGVVWAALEDSVARIRFMDPISEYTPYVGESLLFPRFARRDGRMHVIANFELHAAQYYRGGALKGFQKRPVPKADRLNFIYPVEEGLLCAGNRRIFLLRDDDSIETVADAKHTYLIAPIGQGGGLLACASQESYFLLERRSGSWSAKGQGIPSGGMSYEYVTASDGSVWIEHGLGKVARLSLKNEALSARIFTEQDGIGNSWINLWEIDGEALLSQDGDPYVKWVEEQGRFVEVNGVMDMIRSEFNGPTKGSQDVDGNVWVPASASHGVLRRSADGSYWKDSVTLSIVNNERILKARPGDVGEIWMRGVNFVGRYDERYALNEGEAQAPTVYRIESLENPETLFDLSDRAEDSVFAFPYKDRNLRFLFTAPTLGARRAVAYEVFLSGLTDGWVSRDGVSSFEVANLAAGDYEFKVRVRYEGGRTGPEAQLAFSLEPPFYRSGVAYLSYGAFGAFMMIGIVTAARKRERGKNRLLKELVEKRTQELDAANASLKEMFEKAEAGNAAKSTFIATISHEMRTPLNAIIGPSSMLAEELKGLTGSQKKMLSLIHNSATHLLSLINDILTFSGKGGKASEVSLREFDLHLLLDELTDAFSQKAVSKGLDLRCRIEDGTPVCWLGDEMRIRQLVINLLDNAHKFTDEGAITLEASRGEGSGGVLRIQVSDTGIGVGPMDVESIFDPFVQGEDVTERSYEGTGLGLAICKQLVEQLGGRIGCEPLDPCGSLFWFEIPMESLDAKLTASRNSELTDERLLKLNGKRILVAEDDQSNRAVAELELDRLGCQATFAANGEQAVSLLAQHRFDAVVLDLKMPKMDGLQVVKTLRAQESERRVPVIAASSYLSDQMRRQCREAGFDGFLDKPIELGEFARALGALLIEVADESRENAS